MKTKYFVNDGETEILEFGNGQLVDRFTAIEDEEEQEEEVEEAPAKKKRGRQPKQTGGGRTKAEAIKKLAVNELTVKEIIEKLKGEFPTISPQDVYQVRNKLKKAEPSDSFTGGKKEVDGKTEMIQEYGVTVVNKVIDLDLQGYEKNAIAHHFEVRLTEDQVQEIIDKCV